MEMNAINFKEMVNAYGGPKKVLSIIFNNSYRQVFSKLDLDFDKHIDEERDLFIFEFKETVSGKTITVVKPIEYVEGVLFVDNDDDLDQMSINSIVG